jgi:hypothetical protein
MAGDVPRLACMAEKAPGAGEENTLESTVEVPSERETMSKRPRTEDL